MLRLTILKKNDRNKNMMIEEGIKDIYDEESKEEVIKSIKKIKK